MATPRNEYPRPLLIRKDWMCLNGTWEFDFDNDKCGLEKGYQNIDKLPLEITVPFCPESKLSGIGHTDFINAVWYRREVDIPSDWAGKRVILHIDACDYATTAFVNGKVVGKHRGGYTSFAFDITNALSADKNVITIYAEDDLRNEKQVSGKQSHRLNSYGCFYTRTTGIWQSVWLEAAEPAYITNYKTFPNISNPSVTIETLTTPAAHGAALKVSAYFEGKLMGEAETVVNSLSTSVNIKLAEKHLWEIGDGKLYDLKFTLTKDGKTDAVDGYFGLREVSLDKHSFKLNGRPVFMRMVLDQGFYPDGIYTAPTDAALVFDIEASMACGFNGARLHQKVFEPRFLYHADRLGYMVWAEAGNWGLDHTLEENLYNFLPEWLEEVDRDFSHPSVIGWCPTNETWDKHGRFQCNHLLDTVYDITKAIDKTRPVITSSGSYPTERTDVHDVHDYEQDPEKLKSYYSEMDKGIVRDQIYRKSPNRQYYKTDLPVFVSEYGGIGWSIENGWGYGNAPKTEEEFIARFKGLTETLLFHDKLIGYCYTQLTDVEQEQNGLLTYDRKFKFPPETFKAVQQQKAAIED
ncbi:MAG: beta-galactosidase [Ruminococcaceae bacterium]|nr:beta-galactosidase [Oscillospiraceae bacterium]